MEDTVETAAPEAQALSSSSEIGDRIAAILDAAETSAERIRAEARDEASEILRRAHAEAATRAEELSREPQRLRDEAARDADATRVASEHEATELRAAAAADVRAAEETVRKLNTLRDAAAADVRAAADGLREMAQRLEERVLDHVDGTVERPSFRKRLIGGRTELPSDDLHDRAKAIGSAEKA